MSSNRNTLDPASDLPSKAFTGDVPPFGNQRGLPLIWPKDVQPAMDAGIRSVALWLEGKSFDYLWTSFQCDRLIQPSGMDKTAFEVGFLTRLQQHLRRMPQ